MAPSDKMKRDENTTKERHGEHKEEFSSDTPNGLYSSTGSAMRPAGAPVTNQILPLRTGILGQVPPYGFGASMMGGPSYFEMAVLNQRFAMEEQARMRLMAHAAAIADQRAKLSRVLPAEVLRAQERLQKRRKLSSLPPLRSMQEMGSKSSNFLLPRSKGGTKCEPTVVTSLNVYQQRWEKLSIAAAKFYKGDNEGGVKFIRHYFAKALENNTLSFSGSAVAGVADGMSRDHRNDISTADLTQEACVTSEV